MTRNNKKGYVYLLGDSNNEGVYKIGVTRGDIDKRKKMLQTGNSGEIYTVDYFETDYPFFLEKKLHQKFNSKNVLNEWFELSVNESVKFREYCENEEKLIEILKDNPFFAKELN